MSTTSPFDFEEYLAGSMEGLRLSTTAHHQMWNFGSEKNWALDQDTGILRLTFENGLEMVSQAQIIGTYNTQNSTFMWGWNHPSVAESMQRDAFLALAFGEEHRLEELSQRVVSCNENRAWGYTAIAMRLGNADGAYRGNAGPTTLVYVTFKDIKIRKPT